MNADDAAALMIDLAYGLAIDHEGTTTEGIYATPVQNGARLVVDDQTSSVVCDLTAAECVRLGRYLLACAEANR
jgi:hypothetical protein